MKETALAAPSRKLNRARLNPLGRSRLAYRQALTVRRPIRRHLPRVAGACRAGSRPQPLFHRIRPVQHRVGKRSRDQSRWPDDRLRTPIQRCDDGQGTPDNLDDRRCDRTATSVDGRARFLLLAALVARRHPARLCGRRRWKPAALRPLDEHRRKCAHHRPPSSPSAIAWSPDGRRIAYSMLVPDEPMSLGKAPPKPEGAKWADPLQVIDKVTYRFDSAGYLKSGYRQIFWVPADGGAPTQLTFGPANAGGEVSWTSGQSLDPVQRRPVTQLAARAASERGLQDQHRRGRARRTD